MNYRLVLFLRCCQGFSRSSLIQSHPSRKPRFSDSPPSNRSSLPEEAQPSISAAIDGTFATTQAQSKGKGFQLENALQKLVVNFIGGRGHAHWEEFLGACNTRIRLWQGPKTSESSLLAKAYESQPCGIRARTVD